MPKRRAARATVFGLDLEDLHSAETSGPDAALADALATRVEQAVLSQAAFITTSSEAIGSRVPRPLRRLAGCDPQHLSASDPRARLHACRSGHPEGCIGSARRSVPAVASRTPSPRRDAPVLPTELTLRGRAQDGYLEGLRQLATTHAPLLTIVHQPPAAPDAMVDLARGYDVGLALEQMDPLNRQLCLTNKAFTYILAGVAVAVTDTPGQHALGDRPGRRGGAGPTWGRRCAGHGVRPLGGESGRARLRRSGPPGSAAVRRWHWEHPLERGVLLDLVRRSLS